jgi:predicted patatin/cPLA2 family phospholipase
MDIDTLIFSGGSVKGVSFLGSINYLIENDIIDFNKINKIYCVSSGALFIISLILLKYDRKLLEEEMINYDFSDILNINDISLKSFVNEYGFVNYNRSYIYIQNVFKKKYNCDSMSLLKFYKLFGIHLIIKVVNVSQDKIEYIDHINNPKINLLKLIQMTTSIPLLMKPVTYKNDLYLDGGLSGNSMTEISNDKSLSIEIYGNKNIKINNVIDFVIKGWEMYTPDILIRKHDKKNIKIDLSKLNINMTDFNIDIDTKKKIFKAGYDQTKEHFNHLNRLLNNS